MENLVYLTFSKTFDTEKYGKLLLKLEKMGKNTSSSRWIRNWLKGRLVVSIEKGIVQ